MPLSPEERQARARLGGLTTAARGNVNTATARLAFEKKFETQADPEGVLSDSERAKRAEALRRLHYARIQMLALKKRRLKKASHE